MEKTKGEIAVELTGRILESEDVTPKCLVFLAQKMNLSVKSGGKRFFEENELIIREEIQRKLNTIGGHSGGETYWEDANTLRETVESMDSDELYLASEQVCALFKTYFQENGFSPENLEKDMAGTERREKEPKMRKTEEEDTKFAQKQPFSIEKMLSELEKFLNGDDVAHVLNCICRGQPKMLTAFGKQLPEQHKLSFFTVMSAYFPLDSFFSVMMGRYAVAEGDLNKLTIALERMMGSECDHKFLPTLSAFARRTDDPRLMGQIMEMLEPYIHNNNIHLNEFAMLAYSLNDEDRMRKSLELMEKAPYEAGSLRTYSKIAIRLGDMERMYFCVLIMEDLLDDRKFLKAYVRLAFELMDEKTVQKAYKKVAQITDDPWFVCRYARMAQFLDDFSGMVRAQIMLRNYMDFGPARKTYDILDMRIRREIRNRQHERVQE